MKYRHLLEQDKDGFFIAEVPGFAGLHIAGRECRAEAGLTVDDFTRLF